MSMSIKKRVCIACVATLLIVALALTLTLLMTTKPITARAAESNLHATYGGNQGRLDAGEGSSVDGSGYYHRTDEEEVQYLINTYGANINEIYKIDDSQKLFNFLNGNVVDAYKYGYVTKDMSIAYGGGADANGQYDYKPSQISSNAIFGRVLDGNGYSLNLWSQTGEANYIDQTDGYFSVGNITYRVAGLLCAVNQGTISNLTIEYYSNHSKVNAITGWVYQNIFSGWYNSGLDNNWTQCIWTPQSNNSTIFGIVCGENGAGGHIDNVRVNVNNNLTVIDRQSTSGGALKSNMIFVGGVAGRALVDSEINNCHVNLADNIVLNGTAEGDDLHSGTNKGSLAVVGGILGKIDQTTSDGTNVHAAVLQYCAISGTGMVKALANKAQGNNDYYRAYSGGVVGACLNVTSDNGGIQDGGKESGTVHSVEPGQIKSIISDWTGLSQNNYQNVEATITGQLFGSIGSNVQNCVVLYDLLAERARNGYTNPTLDSFRSAVLTSWVGAYPLSEDGEVVVRFNSDETSIYDIRIHAISDGYDDYTDSKLLSVAMGTDRNKQYSMANGSEGKFIWESNFGNSERLNLRIASPVVAEILTVSANVNDVVNYTWSFGTMTTLSFSNTNGASEKDNSRGYEGMDKILNKPDVAATLGGITLNYTNADWVILRNGVATNSDMSGTALPGTYTMNVKANVATYIDYGYYNESQRVCAWQPKAYDYVITEGVLKYGDGTSNSSDWTSSYDFDLRMESEDPNVVNFEFVRMVRNGEVVIFDEDPFVYSGNKATITITDSTGKNGMNYSFIAYVMDGDNAIVVARTDSSQDRLVKIDIEAPVVDDFEFFLIDENGNIKERINEGQLQIWTEEKDEKGNTRVLETISEGTQRKWTSDRILVRYTVIDNKSGIKFAQSTNGITNTKITDGYQVEVILTSSADKGISYTDNMNNEVTLKLQANVDYMTTTPRLYLYNYTYASSENGYSTSGAIVRFKSDIGTSPWYLEYSYEQDGFGKDIWVSAMAQDVNGIDTDDYYQLKVNTTQSYTINWNMGTTVPLSPQGFKLRMVNESGLYDTVYLSKYDSASDSYIVTDNGWVYDFIINFKVARLYVDASLKSVLVYGNDGTYSYNGESLADILARENADELKAIFGKTYDGTTDYVNSSFRFEVRVDYEYGAVEDGAQFASQTGVGVLYSSAYIKRPQDIYTTLNVKLSYLESNAGVANKVVASFDLTQDISDKYDVYFVSHEGIDFNDEYSVINGSATCEVTSVTIDKLVVTVNMSDYVEENYYYGDTLPTSIDGLSIKELTEGTFDIIVESDLLAVCDALQEYAVGGKVIDDLGNYEIEVEPTSVTVLPKPVYLDVYLDGSEIIPTSVNAGTKHVFTAYYNDINGTRQKATTHYFTLNESGAHIEYIADGISAKGNYKIVIEIDDINYVTADQGPYDENYKEGTYQFFFNITQGTLKLDCNTNLVEYTGKGIEYDAGIPDVDSSIFDERKQLSYKYYMYTEATKWEMVNGEVVINKVLDKNDYMGDGVKPTEIGIYRVEIELAGNESFLSNSYEGFMVITKASTQFPISEETEYNKNVSHAYTGEYFTLSLEEARAMVVTKSGYCPWDYKTGDMSKVTIEYYDLGWKPVSSVVGEGGWYKDQDTYSYRVTYLGDDLYDECFITLTLTITAAEFQNVWFTGASGVYNGKNFLYEISQNIPSSYKNDSSFRIAYTYNNITRYSLDDLPAITEVGEHVINITISMNNYATTQYSVTLSITEAQFTGVSAVSYLDFYDGNQHTVSITGLTEKNGEYYYTVKDEKGVAVKDDNGNEIQVKVTITGKSADGLDKGLYATDAGTYSLTITISASNFKSLTLDGDGCNIVIQQLKWPVSSTWTNMPSKIPSGVSVSDYYGTYTNDSTTTETTLIYTNRETKEVVTPDSNGILPDGQYDVTLNVGNNHYIDKTWSLTVGRINSAELSPVSVAVLCVAVAVMVAAIVTAVVVVNKRKKADAIADAEQN